MVWQKLLDLLPERYRQKLTGKDNIQKIGLNSVWLLGDKIIRMVVTLVVTGWLARYLSVAAFGQLNNAIAYFSLFGAFATLGLDSIIIRDAVKNPEKKDLILGSAFFLRFIASIITYGSCCLFVLLLRPEYESEILRTLVYIISIGIFFQSFDVIDYYFQSQVKSRFTVIARNIAFISVSALKILLLVLKAPLIYFAWAWLAEFILSAFCLIVMYYQQVGSIIKWKVKLSEAKKLLIQSFPIFIAYIAAFSYMKCDQIMIAKMLGDQEAGIYAAASRIFELCFFIVGVLTASFYPSLIHLYEKEDKTLFYKRYFQVTKLFTAIAYCFLIGTLLLGDYIIVLLFGHAYLPAGSVLKIQMIGLIFLFNGGLRSSFLAIINRQDIIMITSIVAAIINLSLNYLLIPIYGIKTSALTLSFTYLVAIYLSNFFYTPLKTIQIIQTKSFLIFNKFKNT